MDLANLLLCIFLGMAILAIVFIVFAASISGRKAEKKFQKSALALMDSGASLSDLVKEFGFIYVRYRSYTGSYLNFYELITRLREGIIEKTVKCEENKISRYISKLNEIYDKQKDNECYSDEKLIDLLKKAPTPKLESEIKLLFQSITCYDNGRIFEKELAIKNLQVELAKAKKKRFLSYFTGSIGAILSVIKFFIGL